MSLFGRNFYFGFICSIKIKNKKLMKKIILIITIISGLYFSCSTQQTMTNGKITADLLYPDSTVKAFLGDDMTKIIFMPDSVKCYSLNALIKPADTTKTIAGYTINKFAGNAAKDYISILQFLIQNKNAFASDTLIKECRFTPNYAFDFYKKKKNAVVLISTDCDMFGFYTADSLITKNIAYPEIIKNYLQPIEKLISSKKDIKDTIQ